MIGCIIQARLGSTRLPGKVMKKIDGKNPVLYYVLKQVKHSQILKKIIVATTDNTNDDEIVDYLKYIKIEHYRGNEKDVLDRFYQCAKKFSLTTIVRITSDNPLVDSLIIDEMLYEFQNNNYDYMTNAIPRTFPYGTEVEIFSFNALEKAWRNPKNEKEKEHVTLHFINNPEKFKIKYFTYTKNLSFLRWTLDENEDFILIQKIIEEIKKTPIRLKDILQLYHKNPELFKINKNVKHKVID